MIDEREFEKVRVGLEMLKGHIDNLIGKLVILEGRIEILQSNNTVLQNDVMRLDRNINLVVDRLYRAIEKIG